MHPTRRAPSLAFSLLALPAFAADLTVRIADIPSAQGSIMVAVYDGPASFLRRPVESARANAAAGTGGLVIKGPPAVQAAPANPAAGAVDIVIKDLPAGGYGVAVFHDANGNGKMDRNFMGIPVEDHAFSNNARGTMGPPSFDQVKFSLPDAGATATISLR